MFGGLGGGETLLILAIALIFIGPKKLPELAKGLGKGIREFNKAKNDLMNSLNETPEVESKKSEEKIEATSTQEEVDRKDQN
ncbi:twin-arginine translocase TatA/TatE family subunit [Bacteriovorax sp. Seq25_V]|uniref:Sec-independent protein translocase subunit TatA/TatB n=1 Tax=Bacteriovorax sp. Seq25_V TaxID=1201288 RepID=UPI000389E62C|nr:twin-arginine translocase TatA/TatE family subunit [Bacteriovorax sp. Seq25_V]EQC44357.1 MttA family protein [Bacteriovorax sp. Seq25_V]